MEENVLDPEILPDISSEKKKGEFIFLPDGAKAIAQIPLPFIEGTFRYKLNAILEEEGGLMEVTDDEYVALKPILQMCQIKFHILLGIPGVDSPRSFLAEDDYDLLLSYSNLEFTPENEASKFIKELEAGNNLGDEYEDD